MRPEDLLELLRKQPFKPFRIVATDSRTYDVAHPDLVNVLRSRFVIGAGSDNGVSEHLEHVALVDVVRIEELPSEAARDKSSSDGEE